MMRYLWFFIIFMATAALSAQDLSKETVYARFSNLAKTNSTLEEAHCLINLALSDLRKLMELPHRHRVLIDCDFDDETYCATLADMDFSGWKFQNCLISGFGHLENLDFTGAEFDGGEYHLYGKNINLENAVFKNCAVDIGPHFLASKTWKDRATDTLWLVWLNYNNNDDYPDFSGLHFKGIDVTSPRMENMSFSAADFSFIGYMKKEHLCKTANYKLRFFKDCHWGDDQLPHDMRGCCFVRCKFWCIGMKDVDFEDAMFIECEFVEKTTDVLTLEQVKSTDFTLEQVKSTWNYKTGNMHLSKWPKYIEKALEEEEKAKAQEEKK